MTTVLSKFKAVVAGSEFKAYGHFPKGFCCPMGMPAELMHGAKCDPKSWGDEAMAMMQRLALRGVGGVTLPEPQFENCEQVSKWADLLHTLNKGLTVQKTTLHNGKPCVTLNYTEGDLRVQLSVWLTDFSALQMEDRLQCRLEWDTGSGDESSVLDEVGLNALLTLADTADMLFDDEGDLKPIEQPEAV